MPTKTPLYRPEPHCPVKEPSAFCLFNAHSPGMDALPVYERFSKLLIRSFTLILILLSIAITVNAQYPEVHNYTRNMYQASTQNWCITEGENNKLYFANNYGLLEFDSQVWNAYQLPNYSDVRSVYYDSLTNRIYAGGFNEFGYYSFDSKKSPLSYHSLCPDIKSDKGGAAETWRILRMQDAVIFQSNQSIFSYRGDSVIRTDLHYKIDCSAVVHGIFFIAGMGEGVSMMNGNLLMKLPGNEQLRDKKVVAILPLNQKDVLLITAFDGIYLFNGEQISRHTTKYDQFLRDNQVYCAAIKGNNIAFGTVLGGVVISNTATKEAFFLNTNSGLQDNTILSMCFDKDENLWLGLNNGIDYIHLNSPIRKLLTNSQRYGSGYTACYKDSMLYLGTNQGLYCTGYPVKSGPEPVKINLVPNMQGQVWCLTEIDKNLFCGNDQGVFVIRGKKAERIPGTKGTLVLKQHRTRPDIIIGCSYQGFYFLKKEQGKWQYSHALKGFDEVSAMFEEDKNGDIWVSHWLKGIFRLTINEKQDSVTRVSLFDDKRGIYSNYNSIVYRYQDSLVFASEGAFLKYDPQSDRLVPDKLLNAKFPGSRRALRLYESPYKSTWAISGDYIGYIREDSGPLEVDTITFKPLLEKLIPGFTNFCFLDADKLLISTEDGFSAIDLSAAARTKKNNTLFFRSVCLNNAYKDTLLLGQHHPATGYPVSLAHDHNAIRFEYIQPEYRNKAAVEYSCFMENFDKEWSEWSKTDNKEYTNLPGGEYTFRVRCRNRLNTGICESSFTFRIGNPWYATTAARGIYLFVAGLCAYGGLLLIGRHTRKAARRAESIKELEMIEQKKRFTAEAEIKEQEIIFLKNQQLEYELKHKSSELASSTMNLIRKNEVLLSLNQKLEKMTEELRKKTDGEKLVRQVNLIRADIRENIEHDNDWDKFASHFDMVYDDYLQRLSNRYPQLNSSDKKLCAYLKMDLSSKEIAPLLNMSIRSVEMARYRLRKKMDLTREDNLTDYLQRM